MKQEEYLNGNKEGKLLSHFHDWLPMEQPVRNRTWGFHIEFQIAIWVQMKVKVNELDTFQIRYMKIW